MPVSTCCSWGRQVLRKPSGRLSVAGAFLALVALVVFLGGRLASSRLKGRIERYRLAGVPVRIEEVPWYIETDSDLRDAGPAYGSALLARGGHISGPTFAATVVGIPLLDGRCENRLEPDETTCVRAETYLATQSEWCATLQALSEYDVCRARTYAGCEAYAEIRHPYLQPLAHGVTFLCLEALIAAHRGDPEGGLRFLTQARDVNRLILSEPFLPNVATAIRGEKTLVKVMEGVVAHVGQPGPEALRQLRRLCVPFGPDVVRQGVTLERLAGLDYFYLSGADNGPYGPHSFSYLKSMPVWLSSRKIEEFLNFTDGVDRVCALPPSQWVVSAIQLEKTRGGDRHRINPLLSLGTPMFTMAIGYGTYCGAMAKMGQKLDQLMSDSDMPGG